MAMEFSDQGTHRDAEETHPLSQRDIIFGVFWGMCLFSAVLLVVGTAVAVVRSVLLS